MPKINLSTIQRLRWPNKCAYCGAEANGEAKTSFTMFAGELKYYVVAFGWTEHKYTISYPVCQKHNGFVYTRMPSSTFVVNLFVFIMIILALIAFVAALWDIKGDIFNYFVLVLATAFSGLMFFALFVSPFLLKPVRISPSGKTLAKVHIRNEDCLHEFCLLNRDIICGEYPNFHNQPFN